jgi:hypothetical protein
MEERNKEKCVLDFRSSNYDLDWFFGGHVSNFDEGIDYADWDISWFCSDPKITTWMCFTEAATASFRILSHSSLSHNTDTDSPLKWITSLNKQINK